MAILLKEVFGGLMIIVGIFFVLKSVSVRDKIIGINKFIVDKLQTYSACREEAQVQQEEINVTYIISFGMLLIFVGLVVMTTPVMGKEIFGALLALIGAVSFFYKNNSMAMGFLGGLSKIQFIQGINNFVKETIDKILASDLISNNQLKDSIFIKPLGVPIFVIGLLVMLIPITWFGYIAGLAFLTYIFVKFYRKKS